MFRRVFLLINFFCLLLVLVAVCSYVANSSSIPQPKQQVKVYIFGAKWCQYCPKKAEVEKLQEKYPDFEVYDIDIDKPKNDSEKEFLTRFHPKKIPLFVVCSDEGCWPTNSRAELNRWLDELAGKNSSGRK